MDIIQRNQPFKDIRVAPTIDKRSFQQNDVIEFAFPIEGYLLPESCELLFTYRINGTIGSSGGGFLNYDISSVFTRLEILIGNTVIEDLYEYGLFAHFMSIYTDDPMLSLSPYAQMYGKGKVAGSNVPTNTTGQGRLQYHSRSHANSLQPFGLPRRYRMKFRNGLFQQKNPIPLHQLKDILRVRLTLAKPEIPIILNSTLTFTSGPTVDLSNPRLLCTILAPSCSTLLLNEVKPILSFASYDYFQHRLNPNAGIQTFQFPLMRSNLLYALSFIRQEDDAVNLVQDAFQTYAMFFPRPLTTTGGQPSNENMKRSLLKQYSWSYAGEQYPSSGVKCFSMPLGAALNTTEFNANSYESSTTDTSNPSVGNSYYIDLILKEMGYNNCCGGLLTGEVSMSYVDPSDSSTRLYTAINHPNSSTTFVNGCGSKFMMGGLFSRTLPDGRRLVCSGGTGGETLSLKLEFNWQSIPTTGTYSPLQLETLLFYQADLTLENITR